MKKYLLIILLAVAQLSNAQSVYFSKDIVTSGNKATVTGMNGTNLAGLGTGLMKVAAGVPSLAVNSDLPVMTATVGGAVPTPPNDATKYFNGQGAFVNALVPTTVVASSTMQSTGLGIGVSPSALLHISKAVNQAAWTNKGVGLRIDTATYTDNSSSGTVAAMYNHYIGAIKNAASSSTTYTIPYNVFIGGLSQGTNVAFTNTAAALGLGGNLYFAIGATATIGVVDANSLVIKTNLSTRTTWTSAGLQTHTHTAAASGTTPFMTYTQAINTGGSAGGLLWTAGAHTSQTTATEITDIKYDLSAVLKSVDGTIATNRSFLVLGRTLTPQTSALTVTNPVTMEVQPPIAGSGTTFTNQPMAIRTTGNISLSTAGNGIYIKEGTNATMGVATLSGGTVVVNTTKVTANSRIFLEVQALGTVSVATPIAITARSAGTSFTISSSNVTDTSIIAWYILEPAP